MAKMYIGGVEGGATHSKLVICENNGDIVASISGPGTNHWMIGIPECAKRISNMVEQAKIVAHIPLTLKLKALGLSLSGCEQEATNKALEKQLRDFHPNISENYIVCSDTMGSIYTATPHGGLVLISGTGSNGLLTNPDGIHHGCGGWGNVMGDEGSAWWISHRAMKIVFDDMDNYVKSPYPINTVWDLIKIHFSIETRHDLLDHCYAKFDKPFFAGLCAKLATAAEDGDELCKKLFYDAGKLLARTALALIPKVHQSLLIGGDLSVVCVGSVWLSWDLLKSGFLKELDSTKINMGLKMKRLTQTMALGAVYLAADYIKYDLPRDYLANYEIFHYYHQKVGINGN